ncbi:MAG: peptidase M16 [Bacillota bacterium]|nr:MAG: peptidase M16 [Bacillota bacterium]
MEEFKIYDNGLRLVVKPMAGMFTVSMGIIVNTGSVNETAENNGISHYIEHMLFKGTKKRSSFEISDAIDGLGSQINAYTAKENTCYYVKSTKENFAASAEILSDIFFNSVFDDEESAREKGVILEEIHMCEDTPEDLCLDILAEAYFGKTGLGRTILGTAQNVEKFTKEDIRAYMDRFYVPSNIVVSVAGNITFAEAEKICDELFAANFSRAAEKPQPFFHKEIFTGNAFKTKDIEQAHIGLCMPSYRLGSKMTAAVRVLNTVFGGGMSSRLFQIIREKYGLAYSVYSYVSQYAHLGTFEIYAGVNPSKRDMALDCIFGEIERLKKDGITEAEFKRGKEQVRASFLMAQESTASQMLLYGKQLLMLDELFDMKKKIEELDACRMEDVNVAIDENFHLDKLAAATVGKAKRKLKIPAAK